MIDITLNIRRFTSTYAEIKSIIKYTRSATFESKLGQKNLDQQFLTSYASKARLVFSITDLNA